MTTCYNSTSTQGDTVVNLDPYLLAQKDLTKKNLLIKKKNSSHFIIALRKKFIWGNAIIRSEILRSFGDLTIQNTDTGTFHFS